ncbi:hypothetical protein R5R35_001795 [Gryllus longicercus]|uniref:Lipase n=1 Tax=Gryllus longicercus TaxID=2509291 RepID=A0AAN9Z7U6_9ORTH
MLPLLLALLLAGNAAADLDATLIRDASLTTPELIEAYGYPSQTHTVQTEDGYILTLHRIPHGRSSNATGEPVFVQHGLLSSSADWVLTGPDHALAYILADAGYDVWLGNFRGNTYSRQHVRYTADDNEFWNFSWNENGKFDLPAMIDYVLNYTGKEKLYYAGHSMGTTSFFVLNSLKPEYNDKIRLMFSLAPIAFMNHVTSPFLKALAWSYEFDEILWDDLGLYKFFTNSAILKAAGEDLCEDGAVTQSVCSNILFLTVGFDTTNLNKTLLPVILAHTPAGAAAKQFLHYSQEVVSAHFRQWDYGLFSNIAHYGRTAPPDYDLSAVTAPVFLFYADNDWVSNIVDVTKLNASLANPVTMYHVDWQPYNHLDYLWGIHSKELVYDVMLKYMPNY